MRENYFLAKKWMLVHEGGFVDHPKDPGGATNLGVTQRVYDAYRSRHGIPTRSVSKITDQEVGDIYRKQYWDAVRGDDLPAGVDYAVFDFAVNSGPSRAIKELQKVLGVTADGIIGQVTLSAAEGAIATHVVNALCHNRLAFMKRLKHWGTFGKGWTRRVMGEELGIQNADTGVIDRAWKLAVGEPDILGPKALDDGAHAKADGPQSVTANIEDALKSAPAWGQGLSVAGIITALTRLEGPLAWGIAGGFAVLCLAAAFLLVRRAIK